MGGSVAHSPQPVLPEVGLASVPWASWRLAGKRTTLSQSLLVGQPDGHCPTKGPVDKVLLRPPRQVRLLESFVETEAGLHPLTHQVRAHRMAVPSGCLL